MQTRSVPGTDIVKQNGGGAQWAEVHGVVTFDDCFHHSCAVMIDGNLYGSRVTPGWFESLAAAGEKTR